MSGEFIVVNKHLMKDLIALNLWDDSMKNRIMTANGSIQNIPEIPQNIKDLYEFLKNKSPEDLDCLKKTICFKNKFKS